MPLIEDTPSAPPSPKPNPIKVTSPSYQGVAVDTRYTPLKALLTHVEGSSWTVDYYSQVLAGDNALSGKNLDRDAVYQQYRHVKGLELKVTTPLTQPTQDQTSKSFTVTGQSNMYPGTVIPNEGDMFIADIGDGTAGVFRITQSEQRSIYKDAAWIIDYVLIDYATPERTADFKEKTVEELVYVADFLTYGQNPLITTSEFANLQKLDALHDEIVLDYFRRFYSNEYGTLLVPGQTFPVYDPFLVKAVLSVFGTQDAPVVKNVRQLNVSGEDMLEVPTIWDVLINKKPSRLKVVPTRMGLVTSAVFSKNPHLDSIRYSGIKYVVYPADPERSEDDLRIQKALPLSDWKLQNVSSRVTDLSELIVISDLPGLPQRDLPPVNRNTSDGYYVLSEAFYKNFNVGVSAMEVQVRRFLADQALDIPALVKMSDTYNSWGPLDQFYQVPVMLMLIRSVIRRM